MTRYSKQHYRLVSPPPDRPGDVERRLRHEAAKEVVNRERRELFPVIDATNIQTALDWQERRLKELTGD